MAENMSTRGRIATAGAAAGAVALALAAAGCAAVHRGEVSPSSVESQAHTLAGQTLDATRAVIGSAAATGDGGGSWQDCGGDLPGQHRYRYTYALTVAVAPERTGAAVAAARADFVRRGYTPVYSSEPQALGAAASVTVGRSWWQTGAGVREDRKSLYISVTSGCVFTTHAPPTAH
jgi:hypothetical protein